MAPASPSTDVKANTRSLPERTCAECRALAATASDDDLLRYDLPRNDLLRNDLKKPAGKPSAYKARERAKTRKAAAREALAVGKLLQMPPGA